MKKLTVIGAGGQMGRWFTKYFAGLDFEVTGYDTETTSFGKNINSFRIISRSNSKGRLCGIVYTNQKNTRNYQTNCKRNEERHISN